MHRITCQYSTSLISDSIALVSNHKAGTWLTLRHIHQGGGQFVRERREQCLGRGEYDLKAVSLSFYTAR